MPFSLLCKIGFMFEMLILLRSIELKLTFQQLESLLRKRSLLKNKSNHWCSVEQKVIA